MLGRWPFTHIVAALGDQSQHGVWTKAMDLRQIGAEQSVERGARVEPRFVRAAKLAAVPTGESPVGGGAQMPP